MNKIEIPAKYFNNFFQNGGQQDKEKYQDLTGQYIHALPEQAEDLANAEIEDQEYVKTKGTVLKAEGDTHEDGGMNVKLDQGDKVLSDYLKVGKDVADKLSKDFDIKVNKTDTYSKVLDKYLNKIGHTEATEELKKYIESLDKQKREIKDENTLALNSEYLMNEINEENTKLQELEGQKQKMFDLLYNQQEESKKEESTTNKKQDGGMIQDLMNKYNISPERVKEMFKDGGELPKYQNGRLVTNPLYNKDLMRLQHSNTNSTVGDYYGEILAKDPKRAMAEIKRLHPELYNNFFKDDSIPSYDAIGKFQDAINYKYEAIGNDIATKYGKDSKQYQEYQDSIKNEGFLPYTTKYDEKQDRYVSSDVRNRDMYLGNYTATRPNYIIDVLPKNLENELKQAGINSAWELKQKRPDLHKKYIEDKGLKSDFFIGYEENPKTLEDNVQKAVETEQLYTQEPDKTNMNVLLMPERMLQNPSFLAPMKFSPKIYTGERVEVTPEQQLAEINRQQLATKQQIEQLPDAQKAATLSSMDSNLATATSKAVSDAERYNAQARERESYENAQVKTRQSLADAQSAAQYQQLMGRELTNFENNLQNQNNIRFQDDFQKWMYINQMNRQNAQFPDIQWNGSTYDVRNPSDYIQNMLKDKTPQAKKGGRFNKKRFGN